MRPPQTQQTRTIRALWLIVGVIVAVLVCGMAPGAWRALQGLPPLPTGTPAPAQAAPPPAAAPMELRLATLNAGGSYVAPTDPTVTRFRYLLDQLHALTGLTDTQIGDATYAGQQLLLSKYGKTVPLLAFMEAALTAQRAAPATPYANTLALLITLDGQ